MAERNNGVLRVYGASFEINCLVNCAAPHPPNLAQTPTICHLSYLAVCHTYCARGEVIRKAKHQQHQHQRRHSTMGLRGHLCIFEIQAIDSNAELINWRVALPPGSSVGDSGPNLMAN